MTAVTDKVEFYHVGKSKPFLVVYSSFQPVDGDLLNIQGISYEVLGRSFTVDRAGKHDQSIRCNVIVKGAKGE